MESSDDEPACSQTTQGVQVDANLLQRCGECHAHDGAAFQYRSDPSSSARLISIKNKKRRRRSSFRVYKRRVFDKAKDSLRELVATTRAVFYIHRGSHIRHVV